MSKRDITLTVVFFFCLAFMGSVYGQEIPDSFKGTIRSLDTGNLSLDKRFEWAQKEFKKSKKGTFYITGYQVISRDKINMGGDWEADEPFKVTVKGEKIKVRGRSIRTECEESYESERGSAPAALIFLHKTTESGSEIKDMHFLDLDRMYEFTETPIYWLGNVDNDESLAFLEHKLDKGNERIQDSFVFAIYMHDHPKVCDKLYGIARGKYNTSVRKNAIFWIGNFKDEKSFRYLKTILREEESAQLKEQVVFALYLNDTEKAIKELIHIAKNDESRKVRKNAVFWLGQKASTECVKALKDMIEGPDEDAGIKESAVFAIGQLPKDEAVPMLIDIAKTNKNPKVRKQAIFWLGQTGDDEALKFFEDILLKK
ncbi:HEAT repeat domain-containing protein [Acidobacteriota bacterium]